MSASASPSDDRNGCFLDSSWACKVCDGEIPYGHTSNCDIWNLEQEVLRLRAEALPEKLRDPMAVLERGRKLLKEGLPVKQPIDVASEAFRRYFRREPEANQGDGAWLHAYSVAVTEMITNAINEHERGEHE